MSTSPVGKTGTNATYGDVARLWITLTHEFIPGLQLLITPRSNSEGEAWLQVEVVDSSAISVGGTEQYNIWASKEFHNTLYLISVGQLFDLLIVAYRTIDQYFREGERFAPPRRDK